MFITSPGNKVNPSLAELVRFSSQALLQRERRSPSPQGTPAQPARETIDTNHATGIDAGIYTSHAAPLMPLRERDVKVLSDLFKQVEIDEIEADILQNLLQRCPEPCWEDNPLEFLEEYL